MQEDINKNNYENSLKMSYEHDKIFSKFTELEDNFKATTERNRKEHEDIYRRLNEKDIQDAVLRAQLDTVIMTTSRIENKINEQNEMPKRNWEKVISSIITVTVTAVITALLALVIKK